MIEPGATNTQGRINSLECLEGEHAKCGGEYCECSCHRKTTDPTPEDIAAADACVVEFHAERGWYGRDRSHDVIARAIAKARAGERERYAAACETVAKTIIENAAKFSGSLLLDAHSRASELSAMADQIRATGDR